MAKGLNNCHFIGNLGRDPDIRYGQSGKPVCKFSLAVSTYKDETKWQNIVIFNERLIENVIKPFVKKGSRIYIEGLESTPTKWEKDGETKYGHEFQGGFDVNVVLLGGKEEAAAPPTTGNNASDDDWGGNDDWS